MALKIIKNATNANLNRHLGKHSDSVADSLEKLSSGTVFTKKDPRPSERAIAEKMEQRVRSLGAAKRNINDAISLIQTAESSMSEISNMISRMKEINMTAASSTVGDQERKFLFIEYEALHSEINRIATNTEFNGIPLLNGSRDDVPESLTFRVDDPNIVDDVDINAIKFEGLKQVDATTESLGIRSAVELLEDTDSDEGISLEDAQEMLIPEDDEAFQTVYDRAVSILGTQRAIFGSMQGRLTYAKDFNEVFQENIQAAKSKIADTDYAEEVSKLTQARIGMAATTSLLAQANIDGNLALNLVRGAGAI